MPNRDVHKMRESYEASLLLEKDCDKDPLKQFEKWFHQAADEKIYEPNAMQIATVNEHLQPSLRTVLLKGFDEDGFVFFTNYESKKGNEILRNDKISLLFWWREHQRQVRIEGTAARTADKLNDEYFHSRPRESQIAALISDQSRKIESREALEGSYAEKEKELEGKDVPLKKNWGGYVVTPILYEFWQGRQNRLHDRIQYTKEKDGNWKMERLAP